MFFVFLQNYFTSTESVGTIRDWGAQVVHLLFYTVPELCLYSSSVLLYIHRDRRDYQGTGEPAQDVQLLFYTAPEPCLYFCSELLYVHRDRLGLGSPGRPPQLSHGFLALMSSILLLQCCFTPTENVRTIRDGFPELGGGFTQLLSSVYILPHSRL